MESWLFPKGLADGWASGWIKAGLGRAAGAPSIRAALPVLENANAIRARSYFPKMVIIISTIPCALLQRDLHQEVELIFHPLEMDQAL